MIKHKLYIAGCGGLLGEECSISLLDEIFHYKINPDSSLKYSDIDAN